MVARVLYPGCKFDHVLILEGEQGIGKSTCCEVLGGEWYGDAPIDIQDKDTVEYVHSHWVVELGELVSLRKADISRLKNFLARKEDDVRKPYMRARDRYPRQCVFIGTVNPEGIGYLVDSTGNRRFWPVQCTKFRMNELRRDRNLLLAEALAAVKAREQLHLPREIENMSLNESEFRVMSDPWEEILLAWMENNPKVSSITTADIYRDVLGGSVLTMTISHQRRIATLLRKTGQWVRHIKGGKNTYQRHTEVQEC
jgi:putative DNA primase/helicase